MPAKAPAGSLPVSYSPDTTSPSDVITRGGVSFSKTSCSSFRFAMTL
jgi:hypothetical protein